MERFRADLKTFVDGLYEGEKKVLVYGEGDVSARIMMIGEAPGEQETLLGRPFVGKAGKNLDAFLELAGMDRRQLYVTNTVKFRPTKISPAGRTVNRPPTQEEVRLFLPWLQREIELVDPVCIITLGNVPLRALLGRVACQYTLNEQVFIGRDHGRWYERKGVWFMPTFHPSALLRDPAKKRDAWEDFQKVRDKLAELEAAPGRDG